MHRPLRVCRVTGLVVAIAGQACSVMIAIGCAAAPPSAGQADERAVIVTGEWEDVQAVAAAVFERSAVVETGRVDQGAGFVLFDFATLTGSPGWIMFLRQGEAREDDVAGPIEVQAAALRFEQEGRTLERLMLESVATRFGQLLGSGAAAYDWD